MLPDSFDQLIRNQSKLCNILEGCDLIKIQHLCNLADLSKNHTICGIPKKAAPDQALQHPDM